LCTAWSLAGVAEHVLTGKRCMNSEDSLSTEWYTSELRKARMLHNSGPKLKAKTTLASATLEGNTHTCTSSIALPK
jgi:hypothetical protein